MVTGVLLVISGLILTKYGLTGIVAGAAIILTGLGLKKRS